MAVNRILRGLHPEIGSYWERITKASEETYQLYLKDVGVSRVSLQPRQTLDRTPIETIIESRLRTFLKNVVPLIVTQQCMFQKDLTCAQILYRAMVLAGPANSEDRKQTHNLLKVPRAIEFGKLHDQLAIWQFARNRLRKYGFQEPEPGQLFDT